MPRRGSASPSRSSAPLRRPVSNVPARAPPAPAPMAPVAAAPASMAQPRQPGMFAQMATTAAGVAVGSAVGHTLGAAMMGGGSRDQSEPVQQQQAPPPQPIYGQQQQQLGEGSPCQMQMKQFLECAQSQHDITLCQGFNEALRECKMNYGISP